MLRRWDLAFTGRNGYLTGRQGIKDQGSAVTCLINPEQECWLMPNPFEAIIFILLIAGALREMGLLHFF